MRIFRNKSFTRFAKKADLDDATLRKVVADAERGLIDAKLRSTPSSEGVS